MGNAASQAISKQAKKVVAGSGAKLAAGAAAGTTPNVPRPPPLGRAVADAPDVIEDPQAPLRKRQQQETQELLQPQQRSNVPTPVGGTSPPSSSSSRAPAHPPVPDANTGFFRGQIVDPRDVAQEKFLVHQSGGQKEFTELAPDLLKFLQDAGPLEKKLNKKLTSARVVKEMDERGEGSDAAGMQTSERRHRMEAATERTSTQMNLVENIEGHSTTRTTNFFTSTIVDDELEDFGLNDLELYSLLRRCEEQAAVDADAGSSSSDDGVTSDVIGSFYQETRGKQAEMAGWTKEQQAAQQELVKNAAKYLQLPIITKDEEANYVGVTKEELEKEFAHQNIDIVDESRVKLVLADLTDLQKVEIKRIR